MHEIVFKSAHGIVINKIVPPKLVSRQYVVCHYEKNKTSPEAEYYNINKTPICKYLVSYKSNRR